MNNDESMSIITEALAVLPANVRQDFQGAAFIKLQSVQDRPRREQVKSVARHAEYKWKRDRSKALDHTIERADPRGGADMDSIELRDLISTLHPIDQSILLMILAGHSRKEIANATNLTPYLIRKRLARIREAHFED